MADADEVASQARMLRWLAVIFGVGLLVAASFLLLANVAGDGGTDCGSVLNSSELAHATPPRDSGCASALTTRRILFFGSAVLGTALIVGGVFARSGPGRRQERVQASSSGHRGGSSRAAPE